MARNAVIGALRVTLGADTSQFQAELTKAQGSLKGIETQMKLVGKRMAKVGAAMTAGLTAPLAGFAAVSLKAFTIQEDAVAKVETVLGTMTEAAGFSLERLQEMAAVMQKASIYGDEEILTKVTANMLTFGNVQGEVFKRAQQAVLDFSSLLDKDLKRTALTFGRALNDPVIGMNQLQQAGVSFSESQAEMAKQMAKVGDMAGAQSIILGELERQFGGQAKAMAETTAGAMSQLANAMSDFRETIGEIVANYLKPLVESLRGVVDWLQALDKGTVKMAVVFGTFAAALGPVVAIAGVLTLAIGAVGVPVALVIAGVTALGAAWIAYGDDISRIVKETYSTVTTSIGEMVTVVVDFGSRVAVIAEQTYTAIKTWLLDKLQVVWDGLKSGIDAVTGFFSGMYEAVVGGSYVPDMVTEIGQWFDRLDDEMTKPAKKATEEVSKAFASMGEQIGSVLASGAFGGDIGAGLKGLAKSTLSSLATGAISGKGSFGTLFGGGLAALFAGPMAMGGTIPAGGFGLVGEAGPEFAFAGSQPLNIQPMGGGGTTVVINADFRGADGASEARMTAQLGQLRREIPRMVDAQVLNTNRRKGGY